MAISDVREYMHLTEEQVEELGRELDQIREEVEASRGADDAAYINRMIKIQRGLAAAARVTLMVTPHSKKTRVPGAVVGASLLGLAKILENMEIGHNVMHGQWDWMRDPKIHSTTWEWDNASTSDGWKHSHNEIHHTYTNIVGKDNDLGYGIMRVDEDQRWVPFYLLQPLWNFVNMCVFEYGIAAYDLELGKNLKTPKEKRSPEFQENLAKTLRKIRKQATKDYVVHPLVALPFGGAVGALTANLVANVVRNVWSH